jgi:hypothetical protein
LHARSGGLLASYGGLADAALRGQARGWIVSANRFQHTAGDRPNWQDPVAIDGQAGQGAHVGCFLVAREIQEGKVVIRQPAS